jgi:hypothetical protein
MTAVIFCLDDRLASSDVIARETVRVMLSAPAAKGSTNDRQTSIGVQESVFAPPGKGQSAQRYGQDFLKHNIARQRHKE